MDSGSFIGLAAVSAVAAFVVAAALAKSREANVLLLNQGKPSFWPDDFMDPYELTNPVNASVLLASPDAWDLVLPVGASVDERATFRGGALYRWGPWDPRFGPHRRPHRPTLAWY